MVWPRRMKKRTDAAHKHQEMDETDRFTLYELHYIFAILIVQSLISFYGSHFFPKHPRLAMNAAHGFTTLVLTCSIHEMKSEKKVGWLVLAFILANTIKEIQRVSTSKCWSVVVLGQLLLAGMIFVPI